MGSKQSGNSSSRRGKPPRRTVTIDMELAKQIRSIAPDADLAVLVRTLLVQFLVDVQEKQKARNDHVPPADHRRT